MEQYSPQLLFRERLSSMVTFLYGICQAASITEFILNEHVVIFCPCRIIAHYMLVLAQNCMGVYFIQCCFPETYFK
jgi:hypothetical protein